MFDINEYLKQTRTVLLTQDTYDELVKRASHSQIIECKDCKYYYNSNETCEMIATRLKFYMENRT